MRLLVADDEKELVNALSVVLKHNQYMVDAVYNGTDALDYALTGDYDGIVLDVMMPGLDGLQVLQALREKGIGTPVLLLTAKSQLEDRVAGLDAGANDYLIKPFACEELLARIRVLLRKPEQSADACLRVGDLEIHTDTHQVKRGGKEIRLSGKEYALLRYMAQNAGIVLSRDRLEEHLWNFDYAGGSNVIDVYIRYLRRKIDEGQEQKLIHTVRGAGYVLKEK